LEKELRNKVSVITEILNKHCTVVISFLNTLCG